MNNNLKLSVTIPTYNPNPAYLKKAIESVLNGGFDSRFMELIIVDNNSTLVNIYEICKKYSEVTYINNLINLGMSGNWNRCIELAKGEYIHILHDDDYVVDGFYTNAINILTKIKPEVLLCGFDYMMNGEIVGCSFPTNWKNDRALGFEKYLQFEKQYIQPPAILISKECYLRVGGFNHRFYPIMDWEMWCRIFDNSSQIYLSNSLRSVYRIHEKNISNDVFNKVSTMIKICYLSFKVVRKSSNVNNSTGWKFIMHNANWIKTRYFKNRTLMSFIGFLQLIDFFYSKTILRVTSKNQGM